MFFVLIFLILVFLVLGGGLILILLLFLLLPLLLQSELEVVFGGAICRIQSQSLLVTLNALLNLPLLEEGVGQVVVGLCQKFPVPALNRFQERLFSTGEFLQFVFGISQVEGSDGGPGYFLQCLPVALAGVLVLSRMELAIPLLYLTATFLSVGPGRGRQK